MSNGFTVIRVSKTGKVYHSGVIRNSRQINHYMDTHHHTSTQFHVYRVKNGNSHYSHSYMRSNIHEDQAVTNSVGGGNIASVGIGPNGEPPKKNINLSTFRRKPMSRFKKYSERDQVNENNGTDPLVRQKVEHHKRAIEKHLQTIANATKQYGANERMHYGHVGSLANLHQQLADAASSITNEEHPYVDSSEAV